MVQALVGLGLHLVMIPPGVFYLSLILSGPQEFSEALGEAEGSAQADRTAWQTRTAAEHAATKKAVATASPQSKILRRRIADFRLFYHPQFGIHNPSFELLLVFQPPYPAPACWLESFAVGVRGGGAVFSTERADEWAAQYAVPGAGKIVGRGGGGTERPA